MNYDLAANPGPSQVFGNLTKSLGGGERGTYGAESYPKTAGSVADLVSDQMANGRFNSKTYRRGVCKTFTAGLGGELKDLGAGFAIRQANSDDRYLKSRAKESEAVLEAVIAKGFNGMMNPKWVSKSFSPYLANPINGLNRFSPQSMGMAQMARTWEKQIGKAIGKSFSLASPLTSGFVPFDLMPFVRTIYPVNNQAA